MLHRVGDYIYLRMGRRGFILVIIGMLWLLRGVSILEGSEPTPADGPQGLFHLYIPTVIRGGLWLASGLTAILCAWWETPRRQSIGYAALVALPIERALSYFGGFVFEVLGFDGYPRGWSAAIGWAAVAVILLTIAGWPEPTHDGREADQHG